MNDASIDRKSIYAVSLLRSQQHSDIENVTGKECGVVWCDAYPERNTRVLNNGNCGREQPQLTITKTKLNKI